MNKTLLGIVAVFLLVAGFVVGLHYAKPAVQYAPLGGAYNANGYNPQYFYNGVTYNKITPATLGVSTTTPAQFSSAAGGFFTISSGSTSFSASTTAVDTNTDINVSQISTSTNGSSLNPTLLSQLGNKICNTTSTASSAVVSIFASTTNPSLNGFTVTLGTAPATNPACFSWSAQGF